MVSATHIKVNTKLYKHASQTPYLSVFPFQFSVKTKIDDLTRSSILQTYSKRRALDSNQRIPYDIGSLANCWFKPLTQPSLNHLFVKERCKYTTIFLICKIY